MLVKRHNANVTPQNWIEEFEVLKVKLEPGRVTLLGRLLPSGDAWIEVIDIGGPIGSIEYFTVAGLK